MTRQHVHPGRVVIVTLNWNQFDDTQKFLHSVRRLEYTDYVTVLVDNGSADGSGNRLAEMFPEVVYMANEVNLGFAVGNNMAMKRALDELGPEYLLLLNNDTVVAPDLLDRLVQIARATGAGVVGAVNYYMDRPELTAPSGGWINWFTGSRREVHDIWPTGDFPAELLDVDAVSGSAIMVTAAAARKVGLIDGDYFHYYEETDWCLRFKKAGYRVVLATRASVRHRVSAVMRTWMNFYLRFRNKPVFITRHAPRWRLAGFFPYYFADAFARILYYWLCRRRADLLAVWLGVTDYLKGNMGRGNYDRVARLTQ